MKRLPGDPEFTDVEFMTADEKLQVYRAWIRFVKNRFQLKQFTKSLYNHLIQHCSFIAHFNAVVFHDTYFVDAEDTLKFLGQFDRAQGCTSVEYRDKWWIQGGNSACAAYYDINNAMVDAIQEILPEIRERLLSGSVEAADKAVAQAQENAKKARQRQLEGQG